VIIISGFHFISITDMRKRIVRQIGYLQGLYRDSRSTEHKSTYQSTRCNIPEDLNYHKIELSNSNLASSKYNELTAARPRNRGSTLGSNKRKFSSTMCPELIILTQVPWARRYYSRPRMSRATPSLSSTFCKAWCLLRAGTTSPESSGENIVQ
jgi:hypothetical protein